MTDLTFDYDPYDPAVAADPYPALARLREHNPVHQLFQRVQADVGDDSFAAPFHNHRNCAVSIHLAGALLARPCHEGVPPYLAGTLRAIGACWNGVPSQWGAGTNCTNANASSRCCGPRCGRPPLATVDCCWFRARPGSARRHCWIGPANVPRTAAWRCCRREVPCWQHRVPSPQTSGSTLNDPPQGSQVISQTQTQQRRSDGKSLW